MEYCGEVMDYRDFQERAERYDKENRRHYYFMTLRADEVIIGCFYKILRSFSNDDSDGNEDIKKSNWFSTLPPLYDYIQCENALFSHFVEDVNKQRQIFIFLTRNQL